jgi:hypothetical protein
MQLAEEGGEGRGGREQLKQALCAQLRGGAQVAPQHACLDAVYAAAGGQYTCVPAHVTGQHQHM